MIDATLLDIPGVSTVSRAPHSQIITGRQGEWHRTVNIGVLSAAPTLETVRQLQTRILT
jgi:hypothetical protein